jgi:RHH-type proline utilization regulon transcriptional repressor/proline dehydrogenase/delta 1-pyrroline-5-carboxylate dehydrogenase
VSAATVDQLRGHLKGLHGRGLEGLDAGREAAALAASLATLALADTERSERAIQEQIARMMDDPRGKAFTTALTDQAFRSHSPSRTGDQIRHLLDHYGTPAYMTPFERGLFKLFELASPWMPRLTSGAVMARIRAEMSRVVLPGAQQPLSRRLDARNAEGVTVNLNHLGEAILGEEEARVRLATYVHDLSRPNVRCVSVKISSIASQLNLLAWEDTLSNLSERMRTLYRTAMAHPHVRPDGTKLPKLVYLDMEEYRDLELTVCLFERVLSEAEFESCSAGIVLQAYLPDAHPIQRRLTAWAQERVERGGAPVRMRIVKGANLAMERFEAAHRGWEQAPYQTKAEVDANYKRMLVYGCLPEHASVVNLGIASHNLFDLSYGMVVRAALGTEERVGFELLEGMAEATRRAVLAVSDDVLIYAPMVEADQMESAIAYLVRRLDENTGPENFLRYAFDLVPGSPVWTDQERRFLDAVRQSSSLYEGPRRDQDRRELRAFGPLVPFQNEADTDWSLAHNRAWILEAAGRWREWGPEIVPLQIGGEFIADTTSGLANGHDPSRPGHTLYEYALADEAHVDQALDAAVAAAVRWGAKPSSERALVLNEIAHRLSHERGELMGAMIGDAGKTLEEGDVEVSEAIDFATYYAHSLTPFEALDDLELRPRGVVLVAPPWNFPLAIPAGGVLAALMAGNSVILKPAPETVLTAWLLAKACWEAGVPRDVLQFISCVDDPVGSLLVSDERVNAVILTGATSTAQLFHRLRPDLTLFAETGGKDTLIITAMSDRDQAISDAVHSAFGHAGQKCSALSLLICEGEVLDDPSFLGRLRDAAQSLPVGSAWEPRTVIPPLIHPPTGALKRALTTLDEGERWILEPLVDPHNPRLWTPGIKAGVSEGSFSHLTEFFGPVLSVMRADDLEDAIRLANQTSYGLTGGLHSLDLREQEQWKATIDIGNGYINRRITGAVVQRQPFGGRKGSGFGPGAKAGGPNYTIQLMEVRSVSAPALLSKHTDEFRDAWLHPLCAGLGLEGDARDALEAAADSDAHAMATIFSRVHDPTQIPGEDNLLRYQPCGHVLVRLGEGSQAREAARCVLALAASGAGFSVSAHPEAAVGATLNALPATVTALRESDETLMARLRECGADRVRSLGAISHDLRQAIHAQPVPLVERPPVDNGRVELLTGLREQSLTIAYHRYGNLGLRTPEN